MTQFGYRSLGFGSGGRKVPTGLEATGPDGAEGVEDGDYKYHIFTATKTGANGFSVSAVGAAYNTVEYLVIAGGAGGGSQRAAGGGAGGMRTATGLSVSVQDYNVTIGAGGAGAGGPSGARGSAGANSVFSSITSTGGGGGGSWNATGGSGGSGGGGAQDAASSPGSGTAGQGKTRLGYILRCCQRGKCMVWLE